MKLKKLNKFKIELDIKINKLEESKNQIELELSNTVINFESILKQERSANLSIQKERDINIDSLKNDISELLKINKNLNESLVSLQNDNNEKENTVNMLKSDINDFRKKFTNLEELLSLSDQKKKKNFLNN